MINTSKELLGQLLDLLGNLQEAKYSEPLKVLSQATVGQHLRHTLEFYHCLLEQYDSGIINYDERKRDSTLETDVHAAKNEIIRLSECLSSDFPNKKLTLYFSYQDSSTDYDKVESTFYRELVYVIEHTVHHMALIKVGLHELMPGYCVPHSFGVAASTLRFRSEAGIIADK